MRVALFSDVHGNREALTSFLKDAAARGCEGLICLGDVVGYGAEPAWCVEVVGALAGAWPLPEDAAGEIGAGAKYVGGLKVAVAGNHDRAVLGDPILGAFRENAKVAARWTAGVLEERHQRFLASLPYVVSTGDALFVHATPARPERYYYITGADDAAAAFEASRERRVFYGHTHYPLVYGFRGGRLSLIAYGDFKGEGRTLANVGSVGQPRDGDPRGAYLVWEADAERAEVVRFEYDVAAAASKIVKAGLPPEFGRRLFAGR